MKKSISIILAILMCFSCFSIISFAETTDSGHLTVVPNGYIGIYTKQDLNNIKNNLSGKYILMNDLEFTEEDYTENGVFYNSGYGWTPIGTYHNPFKGIFDGNNYVIKNLKINETRIKTGIQGYGFFGSIINASVKNLYLLDVDIVVYSPSYNNPYTGGICGYVNNSSEISNCVVSGSITSSSDAGGICNFTLSNTIISNCINLASVTATEYTSNTKVEDTYAAGICYFADGNVTIDKCINIGTITSLDYSGGIVARYTRSVGGNYGTVSNCFNTGELIASESGGIAYSICDIQNSYSISQSATGSIYATTSSSTVFKIKNCFYLDNEDASFSIINGTGKTSEELSKEETFEGWDFDTVWTMDGRTDYPYPELKDVPLIFLGETIPHEHKYASIIEQEATHLEEGIKTLTCFCGDSYTETIEKIETHDYKATVTEPTCTEQGFTTYTCECGDSYVADYVKENGHKYTSVITKEATHLEEGIETFTCFCGDSYTEAIAKIEAHDYKATVTEPTCTEQGYTTYTCECGDSYVGDYVDADGHDYDSAITKEATHLEEGIETFTCHCGDSYTEVIARTEAHDYKATVTEPTCTEQGYTTYTCECGDSYITDYVEANGHDYSSEITTPATHLEEGIKTFTCYCGDSYTEVIARTEKHTYSSQVIKQATCSAKGTILYTCICGDEYIETIPAINHIDENVDFICDICDSEYNYCSHLCHRDNIFAKIVWKIIIFICSLFGTSDTCACGRSHY